MAPHPLFPGVKRADSGAFYYNHDDVKMISLPVQTRCDGYNLTPQELRKYFGVDPDRMQQIPEYLIVPRLHSAWNSSRSAQLGGSWWDITGEVVVYKPEQWIPIVKELSTIPYSTMQVEFQKTTTTVQTSEIYGSFTASFTLSAGGGIHGVRAEVSASTELKASYRTTSEVKQEITEKARLGNIAVKEVAMGMQLQVSRVSERSVHLYLSDKRKGDSLTWPGPETWDELRVKSVDLRDVEALQYHPITMTGPGHSSSLFLQVLPAFDSHKKLTNLHLAVSCEGWVDWYTYPGKAKFYGEGEDRRLERLPMLDNPKPMVTFIPANIEDADKRGE
ncbi:hypothetical protein M758_9G080300 [Ceratodon purpureus]|nr:hypothetical protein M758_9G080300 [Ceratodon purpureus]